MNDCKLCKSYGTAGCKDCISGSKYKEVTKSCFNCKHSEREEYDYPCSLCKLSALNISEQDKDYEILWERVDAYDPVNRPKHYTHGQFECIDVMVDNFGKEAVQHFCLLNAFKYVWRTNYKNGIEDVKKAMWYLDKYLELEEKKDV